MVTTLKQIEKTFTSSLEAITSVKQKNSASIAKAAEILIHCLRGQGKILICGNGGSASDSTHFSSELLNKYEHIRQPLAAISLAADSSTLTSISNDESFDQIFAKQVRALGNSNDVLVIITTSGNSQNICAAVEEAQCRQMQSIALNGKDGGKLSSVLSKDDVDIVIDNDSTARIQEVHGIIIHALCELIDKQFS